MLRIINDLEPFFEDCYRRINVRTYAKIAGISAPTASKLLSSYYSEGLLLRETYRNYILFYANKESRDFIDLSRLYWRGKLKEIVSFIEKQLLGPTIILFGSLSKAEAKIDSDIDLAVLSSGKGIDVSSFEGKLKRKIQVYFFKSIKEIRNVNLRNNILNGYILEGRISF